MSGGLAVFLLVNMGGSMGFPVLLVFNKLSGFVIHSFMEVTVRSGLEGFKLFLNVKSLYFLFSLKSVYFLAYPCFNGQKDKDLLLSSLHSFIYFSNYFSVNCPLNCWSSGFMESELVKSFEDNTELIYNKNNEYGQIGQVQISKETFKSYFMSVVSFLKSFQFKRFMSVISYLSVSCYYFFKNGNGKGLILIISLIIFSGALFAFGWYYLGVLFPNLNLLYFQNDSNDIVFLLSYNSEINGGYSFLKVSLVVLAVISILCCHILVSSEFMSLNNKMKKWK